jgi:hypothetical protein
MKPSELKAAKTRAVDDDGKKRCPSSPRADPPIREAETVAAQVSICRWHDGLVRLTGAKDGAVFFCPIGKQYWRNAKRDESFHRALRYPKRGVV